MKTDLKSIAGFNLEMDPKKFEIFTDPSIQFKRKTRVAKDLFDVFRTPESINPDEKMYYMFYPSNTADRIQDLFDRTHLTYSLVLIPPKKVGDEFIKTTGHYHPEKPGTHIAYPEIYLQLYGRLLLLMQKRDPTDDQKIEEVVLYEMKPGDAVNMLPGYGHCLINHTDEVGLMAGLYSTEFKPFYDPIRINRGMAYYVIEREGEIVFEKNPNYPDAPELIKLDKLEGSKFLPPHLGKPVWEMFQKRPEEYEYLSNPILSREFHDIQSTE